MGDPAGAFAAALRRGDVAAARALLGTHGELKASINEPLAGLSFDQLPIHAAVGSGQPRARRSADRERRRHQRTQPVVGRRVRRARRRRSGAGAATDILMASALGDLPLVRRHLDADPGSIRMAVSDRYFPKKNPQSGGTIYIWTLGHHKTAHAVARQFGHHQVFRFLMERSPASLRLAEACETGDVETVRSLLASDPPLVENLPDEDRRRVADAARNDDRPVRRMLEAGWPADARASTAAPRSTGRPGSAAPRSFAKS
jgi:hypothetical protein